MRTRLTQDFLSSPVDVARWEKALKVLKEENFQPRYFLKKYKLKYNIHGEMHKY